MTLVYGQDPGGTNILACVMPHVGLPREQTTVVAHPLASPVFSRAGIVAEPLVEHLGVPPASEADIELWLRRIAPARLVVTSSARVDLTNARIVVVARRLGLPTLTFLDHWVGLDRFIDPSGAPTYLPDVVGCIDAGQAARVRAFGQVDARVIGHPHLESFSRLTPSRESGPVRVVVISQPVTVDGTMEGALLRPWRDQASCVAAIAHAVAQAGGETSVMYRPHPKERPVPDTLQVGIDRGTAGAALIDRFDVFIGATSMVLFEAALAGRHVVQLDIPDVVGLTSAEMPPHRAGVSVDHPAALAAAVIEAVRHAESGTRGVGVPDLVVAGSTERAAALWREFVGS